VPVDQWFDLYMANEQLNRFGSCEILHPERQRSIDEISFTAQREAMYQEFQWKH
jgi:hypothetical protein